MTGIFYTGEVAYLAEVSVTEQILRKISKFPEILGELSMCKQCVPGSFLSAHALEPGNEAMLWGAGILPQETFLLSYISAEACQCMWNMLSAVQKILCLQYTGIM